MKQIFLIEKKYLSMDGTLCKILFPNLESSNWDKYYGCEKNIYVNMSGSLWEKKWSKWNDGGPLSSEARRGIKAAISLLEEKKRQFEKREISHQQEYQAEPSAKRRWNSLF